MNPSGHTPAHTPADTPAHTLADQIAYLKQHNGSLASAQASAFSIESPAPRTSGTKSARPVLHLPGHGVPAAHAPRQLAAVA